jgi:RHS repeat-associated protein
MHDEELDGLVYNRARYLHVASGRFASRDILGDVDGANLYNYLKSGPVTRHDPSGLSITISLPVDPYWSREDDNFVYDTTFYERVRNALQAIVGDCAEITLTYNQLRMGGQTRRRHVG